MCTISSLKSQRSSCLARLVCCPSDLSPSVRLCPPPSHQLAIPLAGPPHVEFPCTTASVHITQHFCDSVRISPSSFVPLRPRLPRASLPPQSSQSSRRPLLQSSSSVRAPVHEHPHRCKHTKATMCNCTMFYFYFYSFLMDQTVQTLTHTHTHTCALVYISSLYLYRSVIINQAVQTHTCTQAGMHTHTYVHDTQACTHAQFPFF